MIKFGSVCSGIEAASVAWHPLGWEASWLAEIEPFPAAVLKHHYPDTPNLGDMTTIADMVLGGEVEAPDVLVGGTPCFTAGHLVLSETGYVPIETLRPGDSVITHKGRLRRIVRVGSKLAEVGELRGVGIREPIVSTPGHPFLSVHYRNQSTKRNGNYAKVEHVGTPDWIAAKDMPGSQWCALTEYEAFDDYPVESSKFLPKEVMYIAGMYVGDGYIREWKGKTKKAVVLTVNPEKYKKLSAVIGNAVHTVANEKGVVRVTISDTKFAEWLNREFGRLSHLKKIPSWVYGSEYKSEFLRGYLDADGCVSEDKVSVSTTSRSLAYGVADLLNSEGYVASVGFVKTPDQCVIEGRTVNQRDYYQVQAFSLRSSRKARVKHSLLLRSVRSFSPTGNDTVFNIEVEDDHSYIVNGAIVHNCQSFSVAGLRGGLEDDRGQLTLEYVRLADAMDTVRLSNNRPESIIIWENVPGVLSSKDNAFGCFLGALAGEDCELKPTGKRWTNAGYVLGPKRAIAWRILDAQYFGVAQRRRRVFVVASAREGFCPAKVLFEFDGVRRDTAPSREAGQETTGNVGAGVKNAGSHGELVGTLCARDFKGVGNQYVSEGKLILGPKKWPADIASTLNASFGSKLGLENQYIDGGAPLFVPAQAIAIQGSVIGRKPENGPQGSGYDDTGVCFTQTAVDRHAVATVYPINTMTMLGRPSDDLKPRMGLGIGKENDPQSTLSAAHCHAVAIGAFKAGQGAAAGGIGFSEYLSPTLTSAESGSNRTPALLCETAVRRLTPIECERLQGFPDGYSAISWRNKPIEDCPDGHRYKALGNSMAVPVMRWLGKRIEQEILEK